MKVEEAAGLVVVRSMGRVEDADMREEEVGAALCATQQGPKSALCRRRRLPSAHTPKQRREK
jgi:hypothetical protein